MGGTASPFGTPPPAAQNSGFGDWRRNLHVLSIANLLCSVGFSAAWPFLPLVVRSLGVQDNLETWVGHMMLPFYVIGFIVSPIWGGIADHYGRKLMVLRAMLGMGTMMLILPFATTPLGFASLFMLVALFNGFNPAVMTLLAATTPPASMGRAMSFAQTGTLVGQTLGPALGALLAATLAHHHWIFWMSGGMLLTGGSLVALLVREKHRVPEGAWRLQWMGNLRALLAAPGMRLLYLLGFVFSMLWHGNIPVITIFTLQLIEASPQAAGGYSEGLWVGAMAGALAASSIIALTVGGRLLDRLGAGRVLVFTTAAAAVTHLPLLLLDTPLALVLSRIAFGLSVATMQPALFRAIKDVAPAGMEGRAISYAASFQMIGMGLAPFLAGIIGPLFGLRAYFALTILMTLCGLALWLRARRRRQTR